jgi:hypothetical protein
MPENNCNVNCSDYLDRNTELRPCSAAAETLEVRGAFFTLFTGQLKILGGDGVFRETEVTRTGMISGARYK